MKKQPQGRRPPSNARGNSSTTYYLANNGGKRGRRVVGGSVTRGKKRPGILDTSLATLKELPCERFPNNRSAVYFEVGRGPTPRGRQRAGSGRWRTEKIARDGGLEGTRRRERKTGERAYVSRRQRRGALMGADAGSDWVSARLTREHTPFPSRRTVANGARRGRSRREEAAAAAAPLVSRRIFLVSWTTPSPAL